MTDVEPKKKPKEWRSLCPECGARYSPHGGGHCRGGKFGGCCRTFTSDSSAAAHRTGDYNDGTRRCLTDEELATQTRKDGTIKWRTTRGGWTNSAPLPDDSPRKSH